MSLIRDFYGRLVAIGAEGIKFCVVGGLGAVISIGIQDYLHLSSGMEALTADAAGTAVGIVFTFFGNRYWTYAHKRSHGKRFFRETWQFLLWCLLGLGIQEGVLAAGTYGLHWTSGLAYNLVTLVGIGVATVFRFWAYRTFVFVGDGHRPAELLAGEPERRADALIS